MFRFALFALVAVCLVCVGFGCTFPRTPVSTWIYCDVKDAMAVNAGDIPENLKVGEASYTGIISIVTGDSSIDAAKKAGGIKKIYYVDYHSMQILGVYAKTTTRVYGE